jgi:TRIAD3 protein (E3 ubiquitin-protein ligase RNF216)
MYTTYLALEKACSDGNSGLRLKSRKSAANPQQPDPSEYINAAQPVVDVWNAFCAAQAMAAKEHAEAENRQRAQDEGTLLECGCCYSEYPINRMVHCNGDVIHWFCRDCARRVAEDAIGYQKYQLNCVSIDGCKGTFSKDQKDLFLDDKLVAALDKIEQEANLRLADIPDLERCPFCPYAAEYPPVEENKEFRCDNPECGIVSCRLCRKATHIPKSCEENMREMGHSLRRQIEEARSAALIRKCNKCKPCPYCCFHHAPTDSSGVGGTPFIKTEGCNKMTCTRAGCRNVQCYICSKSCDYSHFNDTSRGGKQGNCPLFDKDIEQRHEAEVRAAEEEERRRVAQENPDIHPELLNINFSEKVERGAKAQKAAAAGPPNPVPEALRRFFKYFPPP